MVTNKGITSETIGEWLFTLEKVNQNLPPETNYNHRENMGDLIRYLQLKQRTLAQREGVTNNE